MQLLAFGKSFERPYTLGTGAPVALAEGGLMSNFLAAPVPYDSATTRRESKIVTSHTPHPITPTEFWIAKLETHG